MKIRVLEVEGTAEEIASSDVAQRLLQNLPPTIHVETEDDSDDEDTTQVAGTPRRRVPGVPPEGQRAVKNSLKDCGNPENFMRFLEEVLSWGDVDLHGVKPKGSRAGEPVEYTRYLRLKKQGSRLGAICYVHPYNGGVHLRLAFDSEEALHEAAPTASVYRSGSEAYQVWAETGTDEELKDALELARRAYELV